MERTSSSPSPLVGNKRVRALETEDCQEVLDGRDEEGEVSEDEGEEDESDVVDGAGEKGELSQKEKNRFIHLIRHNFFSPKLLRSMMTAAEEHDANKELAPHSNYPTGE